MSVRISNDDVGIKVTNIKTNESNSTSNKVDTQQNSWEFFKKIDGVITDFLNKQINIPSTAFTPNFVLTTKEAFAKITMVISIFTQLKSKLTTIAEVISGSSTNTETYKRKKYVEEEINKNLGRW